MSSKELIVPALSVIAYFAVFAYCIISILLNNSKNPKSLIYSSLAILSLSIAWFYITSWFIFEYSSFKASNPYLYGNQAKIAFLKESDLFNKAYVLVTETQIGWWWSEQLLLVSCTISLFMVQEGLEWTTTDKQKSYTSSYVILLLGFLGAMSCGFGFFLSQISSVKLRNRATHIPYWMCVLYILSLFSIIISPIIMHQSFFGTNLKLLHLFLFLPVFLKTSAKVNKHVSIKSVYGMLAGAAVCSHLHNSIPLFEQLLHSHSFYPIWQGIWVNFCQASITFDLFCVSLLFIVFLTNAFLEKAISFTTLLVYVLLTLCIPLFGVSFSLPLFLAFKKESVEKQKTK